jgi:hypothetical protein
MTPFLVTEDTLFMGVPEDTLFKSGLHGAYDYDEMPRRPAQITQADVRRIIRAAKREGAAEVEIKIAGEQSVRFTPSVDGDKIATQDVIEITPQGLQYVPVEFETAYQPAISGESCQSRLIFGRSYFTMFWGGVRLA